MNPLAANRRVFGKPSAYSGKLRDRILLSILKDEWYDEVSEILKTSVDEFKKNFLNLLLNKRKWRQ